LLTTFLALVANLRFLAALAFFRLWTLSELVEELEESEDELEELDGLWTFFILRAISFFSIVLEGDGLNIKLIFKNLTDFGSKQLNFKKF
jgi:hypothetical protein